MSETTTHIEKKTILVPELRFEEFDGEWKEYSLNQLLELLTDFEANGSFSSVKENVTVYDEENFAWYVRSTDLENNSSSSEVKYVDEGSYEFLSKTKLFGNELLVAKRGEIGKVYFFKFQENLKATLAPNLYLLKLKPTVNSFFIYSHFKNFSGNKKLLRINASSTIGALYKDDVKAIKLNVPPIPEQQKIASFLSAVDEKIQQLTHKKELLEDYKNGVMQKIFSQQIRFRDENGSDFPEWEETKLKNILVESRIKGDTGDKAKKITVKLWGRGVFEKEEKNEGSAQTQYFIRKKGQFIYSKLDFLNCAFGIIPDELDGYQSTVDLPCFDYKIDVNSYFLLERIKQRNFYKKNGDRADGSRKAKRIHASDFLDFTIFLPCFEEQNKIGQYLKEIDSRILQVDDQLTQTQAYKRGLLQKMFV